MNLTIVWQWQWIETCNSMESLLCRQDMTGLRGEYWEMFVISVREWNKEMFVTTLQVTTARSSQFLCVRVSNWQLLSVVDSPVLTILISTWKITNFSFHRYLTGVMVCTAPPDNGTLLEGLWMYLTVLGSRAMWMVWKYVVRTVLVLRFYYPCQIATQSRAARTHYWLLTHIWELN